MLLLLMPCIFSWVCDIKLPALDSGVFACKPCRCWCMFSIHRDFMCVLAWGMRWQRLLGRVWKVEPWTQDFWAQQRWWLIVERILRGVLWEGGVRVFRTRGWSGLRLSMSWGMCSARWDTPDLEVLEGGELYTWACWRWCCPWCCRMMTWCGVARAEPGLGDDPGLGAEPGGDQ